MPSRPFRVPLRWRDLDNQGHVYHAEYLTLLDQARTAWLQSSLGMSNPDEYVIARIEVDYLNELTMGSSMLDDVAAEAHARLAVVDAVDVTISVKRLGEKSVTTEEMMSLPNGAPIARASTVLLVWDRAARCTRGLSPVERELIAPFLMTAGYEA